MLHTVLHWLQLLHVSASSLLLEPLQLVLFMTGCTPKAPLVAPTSPPLSFRSSPPPPHAHKDGAPPSPHHPHTPPLCLQRLQVASLEASTVRWLVEMGALQRSVAAQVGEAASPHQLGLES